MIEKRIRDAPKTVLHASATCTACNKNVIIGTIVVAAASVALQPSSTAQRIGWRLASEARRYPDPMSPLRTLDQSSKLKDVLYEIRGQALVEADRLESEGHTILKLNTGNPAVFGFEAPFQIVRDMIEAVPHAHGYSDSRGIMSARRAVVYRYEQDPTFPPFGPDDVYLGNGVSELITMVMQALLDEGDEVLIPAPDYPLWTAMTSLGGGTPGALPRRRARTAGSPTSTTSARR